MRIGVTISRTWDDYEVIFDVLQEIYTGRPTVLVHGASQMDWFVAGVAFSLGMQLEAHPADWKNFGKGAGVIRNNEMVASGADLWLAFIKDRSPGASHCAARAAFAGIPTQRYER